LTEVLIKPGT